jgi:hypothetical protein
VRAALEDPDGQFERGPVTLSARGTATDDRPAFVVQDRNYLSARWPDDAYLFGRRFRDLLESGYGKLKISIPNGPARALITGASHPRGGASTRTALPARPVHAAPTLS